MEVIMRITMEIIMEIIMEVREGVQYYFADFVRKGGGGTPQIRNWFFAKKNL